MPPVVPPDSTTQEFTVQIFEAGAPGTMQLSNDVWVFDRNNIWVVGDFYMPDSTVSGGNKESNIIRWDGKKWYPFGQLFNSSGFSGVIGLDANLLYFASIGLRRYKNGVFSDLPTGLPGKPGEGFRKIWASSETNIWGVGLNGFVVHYDGVSWKKMNFPEGWNFGDVVGSTKTGLGYAYVADFSNPGGTYIAELRPDTVRLINKAPEFDGVSDLYLVNDTTLLSVGYSLRLVNIRTGEDTSIVSFGNDIPDKLAYQSEKDFFVLTKNFSTRKNVIRHYNGKRYTLITLPSYIEDISFYGTHASNNTFAFVGDADNGKSVIVLFTRNS